jgi:hypothetical protein
MSKFAARIARLIEAGTRNGLTSFGFSPGPIANKLRSVEESIRFESAVTQEAIHRTQEFARPYDANYRAFSQFNEDGILQYLIRKVGCPHKTFVEIGTEDYRESNTRFLLEKDWWSGVTVDAGNEAEEWMKRTSIYFLHDIRHVRSFVTTSNIESILCDSFPEIDILSIDVDGVDYHLWKQINCHRPRIVMLEFNPLFGSIHKVVTPYRDDFSRKAHHSTMTCYGASLSAMVALAIEKSYSLVETSNGPNAFFIANEHLGDLKPVTVEQAWRNWNIKESFNADGSNDYVYNKQERLRRMSDGVIIDLTTGQQTTVGAHYRDEISRS